MNESFLYMIVFELYSIVFSISRYSVKLFYWAALHHSYIKDFIV